MTWAVADVPDLGGRTAVVSGANGGLGLETARALAGAGARGVMAARDAEKARAARSAIRMSSRAVRGFRVRISGGFGDEGRDASAMTVSGRSWGRFHSDG